MNSLKNDNSKHELIWNRTTTNRKKLTNSIFKDGNSENNSSGKEESENDDSGKKDSSE